MYRARIGQFSPRRLVNKPKNQSYGRVFCSGEHDFNNRYLLFTFYLIFILYIMMLAMSIIVHVTPLTNHCNFSNVYSPSHAPNSAFVINVKLKFIILIYCIIRRCLHINTSYIGAAEQYANLCGHVFRKRSEKLFFSTSIILVIDLFCFREII